MTRSSRGLFGALIAALALSLAVSSASATGITAEPTETVLSATNLTFTEASHEIQILCNVTLGASFNASIANSAGAEVGHVNEGRVTACSEQSAEVVQASFPWEVALLEAVALPVGPGTEGKIDIIGVKFLVLISGFVGCLYLSTLTNPVLVRWTLNSSNQLTSVNVDETQPVVLQEDLTGLGLCPTTGFLLGSFGLEPPVTLT